MKYVDLHNSLKDVENFDCEEIVVDEKTLIQNFSFKSNYRHVLPGGKQNQEDCPYLCYHSADEPLDLDYTSLAIHDADIKENVEFRYHIFRPAGTEKVKGYILLFHGFNEKHWAKYLPWAHRLVELTGKAVVLFPLAFHMNRAPAAWSDSRQMYHISQQRKKRHPAVMCSSLSNVAISTRLHHKPQRFIWSGLQTYYDVIDFVEQVKTGQHPAIAADASVDFFSYSIGSFLAQILIMTNKNGYFSQSKFCTFCGGAVFNRLSPVTKFILDSEANVSLYSYVVEHLESHMKNDELLNWYLSDAHPEGVIFRSMLNYKTLMDYREEIFSSMSSRVLAIALVNDTVVPPYEVVNTLNGAKRTIPIPVEILDFPYNYKHEDPFPVLISIADEVDEHFTRTFEQIGRFLR